MSNEVRDKVKPEIGKIMHKWILQTRDEFDLTQNQMSVILEMSPRSYAALEAKKYCCGLLTFQLYLFRGCHDALAFLLEINEKLDELIPIQNPEEVVSREFLTQLKWIQRAATHGYICPNCGQNIEFEELPNTQKKQENV